MIDNHATVPYHAYVLHRRAYKESSLLVDVLVREFGKITLLAKGAKRKKSQFSGVLEPFNLLKICWTQRGDLGTLILAERCEQPVLLVSRPLYCGLYLNELMLNLLSSADPHVRLFDHYHQCIAALNQPQVAHLEDVLRYFEMDLLREIGYGLQLEYDAFSEEPISAECRYTYSLDDGPVATLQDSAATMSGATLLALANGMSLNQQQRQEAKRLLRRLIDYHLDGKPLRSRDLFATLSSTYS